MCSSERRIRSAYPSYKGEMEKYFSIFPLVDVERRGREGGRGRGGRGGGGEGFHSFLHLLCALHSSQREASSRTYVYFMHSNGCSGLMRRGRKKARSRGGRGVVVVGCRIVGGRVEGREGDSWSYQEATYKIIRHDGHAHHPAGSPITADCI